MSKKRKTLDLASTQFYKFPKWLLAEGNLKKLSPQAKLLYMVIMDREELSLKNAENFTDKEGYLFQYFDQVKAGELLGLSKNAIIKAFKDLQEYNLIEVVRQGQGKPNRLYVLDYEVSSDTLKELSYENKKAVTAGTDTTNSNSKNNDSNNSIPQKQNNDTRKSKKNNFGNNYQNKPKNKNGIKCVNDTFKNYEADELEKKLLQSQKGKFEDKIKIPIAKEKEDITEDYWNIN